jgi:hypothetical protein
MKLAITGQVAAVMFLSLATGCTVNRQGDAKWEDPFFRPPGETSHVVRIFDETESRGVAADATLGVVHFSGSKLNSLGESFVSTMLDAPRGEDAKVELYVDLTADDPMLQARTEAVEAFLLAQGLGEGEYSITRGINPASTTDAARSLQALGASAAAD